MKDYKVLLNSDQEIKDSVSKLIDCGLNFEVVYTGLGQFPATLKYKAINDVLKD